MSVRIKLPVLLAMCMQSALISAQMGGASGEARVSSGKIIHYQDFPSQYVVPRNIDVWLPEGYEENAPLPVLYMHDGQMLFDSTITWNRQEWGVDEVVTRLVAEGRIRRPIVVGIWNLSSERHSDYFPEKPLNMLPEAFRDSLLRQGSRSDGQLLFSDGFSSNAYLRFIVEELKPFIDREYTTLPDRANTFVAGSSMGGLISLYAICEYPEIFGGAACLSTHWVGTFTLENNPIPAAFLEYLRGNLPEPETHRIYFDHGTGTLDGWYGPLQAEVDQVMEDRGFKPGGWITRVYEGEDHSEIAWNRRLHVPLEFLLGD